MTESETVTPRTYGLSEALGDFDALFPDGGRAWDQFQGCRFLLCIRGSAVVEIDGVSYRLRSGVLLSITPCRSLRRISMSDDLSIRLVAFAFEFLSDMPFLVKTRIAGEMASDPVRHPDSESWRTLTSLYDFMCEQNRRTAHPTQAEVIKALFFVFIAEVSRLYAPETRLRLPQTRPGAITDDFFTLLHHNFRTQHFPAFYAGELNLTEKYLSKVIGTTTGRTPSAWIADFLMRESRLLLQATDRTVGEISEMLGFPNSSFFARFFRRHAGCSPRSFRKRAEG